MSLKLAALSLGPLLTLVFSSAPVAAGEISGLQPDRRPQGAPVMTAYPKDGAWYRRALTGIEQPYPASLRFLEDQGAWFTPFIHPGMTGPYDIRGWHHEDKPPSP